MSQKSIAQIIANLWNYSLVKRAIIYATGSYTWEIYPNPIDEMFTIGGNIDVDGIIVDTWCIPEPATLGLLLLGGLAMLRRRRSC